MPPSTRWRSFYRFYKIGSGFSRSGPAFAGPLFCIHFPISPSMLDFLFTLDSLSLHSSAVPLHGRSHITSWKIFGYNFIVVMAGVSSAPLEVVEAARLDNIPTWRIFLNIVVPMSSSTGIYVLILSIVTGMQQIFTPINMVTKGGPDNASTNLIYAVYDQAFGFFKTGTASAYAILMMLLFGFLLFLEFKFVEKSVYYEN